MCWFDLSYFPPLLWKEIMKALFEVVIVTVWTYQSNLSLSSIFCIFPFVLCSFLLHNMEQPDMFTVDTSPKLLMEWEI